MWIVTVEPPTCEFCGKGFEDRTRRVIWPDGGTCHISCLAQVRENALNEESEHERLASKQGFTSSHAQNGAKMPGEEPTERIASKQAAVEPEPREAAIWAAPALDLELPENRDLLPETEEEPTSDAEEPTHFLERIRCPKCRTEQDALVQATALFNIYCHTCECGYVIIESEWERVTEEPTPEPEIAPDIAPAVQDSVQCDVQPEPMKLRKCSDPKCERGELPETEFYKGNAKCKECYNRYQSESKKRRREQKKQERAAQAVQPEPVPAPESSPEPVEPAPVRPTPACPDYVLTSDEYNRRRDALRFTDAALSFRLNYDVTEAALKRFSAARNDLGRDVKDRLNRTLLQLEEMTEKERAVLRAEYGRVLGSEGLTTTERVVMMGPAFAKVA